MRDKIIPPMLAATIILVLGVGWQVHQVSITMQRATDVRPKEDRMTTVTWKSGGATVTHSGSPHEGESFADFVTRFRAEVDALKQQFPPDP